MSTTYKLAVRLLSPVMPSPVLEFIFTKTDTIKNTENGGLRTYLKIKGLDPMYAWRMRDAVYIDPNGTNVMELEPIVLVATGQDEDQARANSESMKEICNLLREQLLAAGWTEQSGEPLLPAISGKRLVKILLPVTATSTEDRFGFGFGSNGQSTVSSRTCFTKTAVVDEFPAAGTPVEYSPATKASSPVDRVVVDPDNDDTVLIILKSIDLGTLPSDGLARAQFLRTALDPSWSTTYQPSHLRLTAADYPAE